MAVSYFVRMRVWVDKCDLAHIAEIADANRVCAPPPLLLSISVEGRSDVHPTRYQPNNSDSSRR